jgi:hypothetical protein
MPCFAYAKHRKNKKKLREETVGSLLRAPRCPIGLDSGMDSKKSKKVLEVPQKDVKKAQGLVSNRKIEVRAIPK